MVKEVFRVVFFCVYRNYLIKDQFISVAKKILSPEVNGACFFGLGGEGVGVVNTHTPVGNLCFLGKGTRLKS